MEPARENELKQHYNVVVRIGYVFLSAVFLYGAVVAILVFSTGLEASIDPDTASMLLLVFAAISVIELPMTRFFINVLLSSTNSSPPPATGPSADGSIARLRSAALLGYAFSEIPALLGFVLAILTGEFLNYLIFLAISLAAYYFNFPRYSGWLEYVGKRDLQAQSMSGITVR